jgi:Putative transposase of IS4/5 family (DUF4096)
VKVCIGRKKNDEAGRMKQVRLVRLIEPYFPLSHGVERLDDRRAISRIIHVIRNGLRWCDAPKDNGPHKTLNNRFVRWSRSARGRGGANCSNHTEGA